MFKGAGLPGAPLDPEMGERMPDLEKVKMIRPKSRLVIPTVQVFIAGALIASNYYRPVPRGEDTLPDSSVSALDIQSCWALNAPAAMVAHFQRVATYDLLGTYYPLYLILSLSIFLPLVWLLWYALCIEAGGKGLSVLTPKTGIRRAADVLMMALGASAYFYGNSAIVSVYQYQALLWSVYSAWTLLIMGFYGHDLWASFRAKGTDF